MPGAGNKPFLGPRASFLAMPSSTKIVLIGAGSLQFGLGTVGSILARESLAGSTICLHDVAAENLALVHQACQSAVAAAPVDFTVEATTDRADALTGADFIVNAIEVGPRFKWFELDMTVPRDYGYRPVFGENGGPGGLFHGLRVIPPILEICADIQRLCPDAWFINFSNPMSRICLAIQRAYPSLRFVGLCHEIKFAEKYLPEILGTPWENVEMWAGGLNHFGVVVQATYKDSGRDALPDIRRKAPAFLDQLHAAGADYYAFDSDVLLTKFVLETYGYLPYTTDSHYGEYLGAWGHAVADHAGIQGFYDAYKTATLSQGRRIRRLIKKGKGAKLVVPDDERAVPIIAGILADSGHAELSVNLPNAGTITNLPGDLVVESPATVDKDGVHPVPLGEYPRALAALLRVEASVQDLAVAAALEGSRARALEALLADPNTRDPTHAEAYLDAMLEIQRDVVTLE